MYLNDSLLFLSRSCHAFQYQRNSAVNTIQLRVRPHYLKVDILNSLSRLHNKYLGENLYYSRVITNIKNSKRVAPSSETKQKLGKSELKL